MRGIKILSRNERGDKAILQNQADTREANFLRRSQMNAVYKIVFDNEHKPYSLTILSRSSYITPDFIRPVAEDMMSANGATEQDYEIREVDE